MATSSAAAATVLEAAALTESMAAASIGSKGVDTDVASKAPAETSIDSSESQPTSEAAVTKSVKAEKESEKERRTKVRAAVVKARLERMQAEAVAKSDRGEPLKISPEYTALEIEPRDEVEGRDKNFPPHVHAACQVFVMTGNLGQAVQCKQDVDQFLQVMALGPDGVSRQRLGRACLCWLCGRVGIPLNISDCTKGNRVRGVCSNCGSDEQTNFVRVCDGTKSVVPWIETTGIASDETIAAAEKQEKEDNKSKKKTKSKVKPNAKCPCESGKKYKKCCGKGD